MATQPVEAVADAPAENADAPATNETPATETLYPDDQPAAPVEDAGENDNAAEQAEADTPAVEPLNAPNGWTADDKASWEAIPRATQETIIRRAQEQDRVMHQRTQEAANAQRNTEGQAREAVMQAQQHYRAQIQAMMGPPPEQPNPALLTTGQEEHRNLFFQQEARFRQWGAQQQQLQQHLAGVEQQAAQLEQQHRDAQLQTDHASLSEQLGTEWTDPSSRQKLLTNLQPIGGELGYSADLMAQATATDILALKKAFDWKAKADKWDDMNKRKMTPVRDAKSAPKVTQPGTAGAGTVQTPKDAKAILYPNDVRR